MVSEVILPCFRGSEDESADRVDMHKQALQKLSALIRDRDVQIEALTQKNDSLLHVLQQAGGGGTTESAGGESMRGEISRLLEENQSLSERVSQLSNEREQIYNALQTKHQVRETTSLSKRDHDCDGKVLLRANSQKMAPLELVCRNRIVCILSQNMFFLMNITCLVLLNCM